MKTNQVVRQILEKMLHAMFMPMLGCFVLAQAMNADGAPFAATGPTQPTPLGPALSNLLGAVKVTFDQLPTSMSFDLPWHYSRVTENGIKCAEFAMETYDDRAWVGTGANASFEVGMDQTNKYERIWIEQQTPARIVVRIYYALCNSAYGIAHNDIASGSPYGVGDWGDEWWYIYPDGTCVRRMKLYSGLAFMSQPFGFYREPPAVDHEFLESIIVGPAGHTPDMDINSNPTLLLYKMFGNGETNIYATGLANAISYNPCPNDFGDNFRDANVQVINTKSTYKPFLISKPDGLRVEPYTPAGDSRYSWIETWMGYPEPSIGYVSAVAHMINWRHYRRTSTTAEQIYLQGMTSDADPRTNLMKLAWSWIIPPQLQITNAQESYLNPFYDPAQKAYTVPRGGMGPVPLSFQFVATYTNDYLNGTMWLVNPTIIVSNWNQAAVGDVSVNNGQLVSGIDFRAGYETNGAGTNLVLWLNKTYDLNNATNHSITMSINPAGTNTVSIVITNQPAPLTVVNAGQTVTLTVGAYVVGSTNTLNYQWQSNFVNIVNATNATYTSPPLTVGAVYDCILSCDLVGVVSSSAVVNVNQPQPPPLAPLLWLPFENSLADLGYGLTHTISSNKFPSGTSTVVFSNNVANTRCGSASLYFPGDGSFIKVANASDLKFNSANAFTVSAWIKTTNTAGAIWAYTATNVIVGGGGTHTITCWVSSGDYGSPGTVALDVYFVGSTSSGSTKVNDGNWHNVVVTYNAANNWYIYIDGVQRASKNMAAANEGANSDTGKWYTCIGATSNTNWPNAVKYEPYKGLCDEVTYWSSALSASQVASNYTSGVGVPRQTLNVAASGGNVIVSWSWGAYKLQQNSTLTNPSGWTDVPGGTISPVTVTIGAGSQFFRLVSQ